MDLALVTGASRGIGRASALGLARAGISVIACARDRAALDELGALARRDQLPIRVGQLDVACPEAGAKVAALVEALGQGRAPGILVNNAGHGCLGPLELLDDAALRRQFEVNLFGLLRVTQALIPAMRVAGRGRVILMSSVLGRSGLPLHGAYCASKYALEGLGDAMRQELAPFGVGVVLLEPGSVATEFDARARAGLELLRRRGSPYNAALTRCEQIRARSAGSRARPEQVADAVVTAATSPRPRPRSIVPWSAALPVVVARALPTTLADAALAHGFGLDRRALGSAGSRRQRPLRDGVALVTGAAGGIGSAVVAELLELGMRVWATDLDRSGLEQLRRQTSVDARAALVTRELDVRDEAGITALARELASEEDLSLLINNAGYAELGPVELVDPSALVRQFDVNVFGLLGLTRALAPQLRARGCARIINLSSVAGRVAFPFMGVYHASKYAVEAICDALRVELAGFGVDVLAIEPVFIRSKFAGTARATTRAQQDRAQNSPWEPIYGRMDSIVQRLERLGGQPADVAKVVRRAVLAARPRARYQAPWTASLAVAVLPRVPARVLDRLWRPMFELDHLGR